MKKQFFALLSAFALAAAGARAGLENPLPAQSPADNNAPQEEQTVPDILRGHGMSVDENAKDGQGRTLLHVRFAFMAEADEFFFLTTPQTRQTLLDHCADDPLWLNKNHFPDALTRSGAVLQNAVTKSGEIIPAAQYMTFPEWWDDVWNTQGMKIQYMQAGENLDPADGTPATQYFTGFKELAGATSIRPGQDERALTAQELKDFAAKTGLPLASSVTAGGAQKDRKTSLLAVLEEILGSDQVNGALKNIDGKPMLTISLAEYQGVAERMIFYVSPKAEAHILAKLADGTLSTFMLTSDHIKYTLLGNGAVLQDGVTADGRILPSDMKVEWPNWRDDDWVTQEHTLERYETVVPSAPAPG